MPRRIPRLDLILAKEIDRAVRLARAGDIVRVALQSNAVVRSEFHPARLEYLYEVAYLQVFIRWEVFLEATLLRYLCGHASRFGIEAMRPGSRHFPNIASAMRTILGTLSPPA